MCHKNVHSGQVGSRDPIEGLSKRQLEVLELLAKGLTNKELAGVLDISPATVRTHVTAVLARIEVSNRTEAAAKYVAWNGRITRSTAPYRRPAIAVLPLVAADGDERARTVAGAFGQDLATLFARWCWFPVIAHAGAVPPGAAELSFPEVGQQLGACFLVDDGTLRRLSSWRLSIRIVAASTGHCMWNERYDFSDEQLFAAQDAVCASIVARTYPMLIAHHQAGLRHANDPNDLQPWELAFEGMRLVAAREAASNALGQSLFHAALEREPELTLAHYGLGLTHHENLLNQWGPCEDECGHLRASAERCLTLAPHSAEGHYLLGLYFQAHGDHPLAVRSLVSALRRNSSFAPAHALLAVALQLSGRSEEALTSMNEAERLDPDLFLADLATFHFLRGAYHETLQAVQRMLVSTPRYAYSLALAAASASMLGDIASARDYACALRGVAPDFMLTDRVSTIGPSAQIAVALKQIQAAR